MSDVNFIKELSMDRIIKITSLQAFSLIILVNIPSSIFFIPSQVVQTAKQDAWISVLMATFLAAFLIFYQLADLGKHFPEETIVQYSKKVMGKYLGVLFGIALVYYFFQNHCWAIREFSELTKFFLVETPLPIISCMFSVILVYAVYSGLEVIGRCAVFVFPLGIIALSAIGCFNYMNIDFANLLPVMENKFSTLLYATLTPLDWLSVGFAFGGITPYIKNKKDLKKIGLLAVGFGGLILTVFSIVNITVFNTYTLESSSFPLLALARMAQMPFLERIEILIIILWTSWIFIKGALFSYLAVMSISQFFQLEGFRFLIIPETILATAYSIYQYESFTEMSYLFSAAQFYYLTFSLGIPLILWLVFRIRLKLR